MLGRAIPLWILGLLGLAGGLLSAIVMLQFAEVIPWAGNEATFIGGPWTGVVAYALAAVMLVAAGYGWIMVKPWASMITILAALVGFFIPFISYIDGSDPRSSALGPLVVSVLMLFLTLRPSTNRAMAAALAGQGSNGSAKTPPPKPMSAARKREVAEEQKRAARQQGTATPALAAPANSMATTAVAAATATATQAISALPKAAEAAPVRPMVADFARSAASALGMSSRTPAKPGAKAAAPPKPAPRPATPAAAQRPRGFRADEV